MIGLFGGAFDPVHFGHLRPALEVCERLSLSTVRFLPTANPPHRSSPVASFQHRVQMLELALPMDARFELDDREQRLGGVSYTVRTLESLRKDLGDRSLALMIGADQFAEFESWHRWQEIIELVHLVVMNRPGNEIVNLADWAQQRRAGVSGDLEASPGGSVLFVEVTPVDISSTTIRQALATGQPVTNMLPAAVLNYIEQNKLYR